MTIARITDIKTQKYPLKKRKFYTKLIIINLKEIQYFIFSIQNSKLTTGYDLSTVVFAYKTVYDNLLKRI